MEIYIDNKKLDASDNETIIQVADRNNIHIPRFCYHKRLSIVASCRMCLLKLMAPNIRKSLFDSCGMG